jgi:DNA-binding transcriptional LysR family regulator
MTGGERVNRFELCQLRCFVAVADELHFSRAAARLNMTQPPLSRKIQQLERELDVLLLERSRRVVKLTAAGQMFLLEARRILRLSDDAVQSVQQVANSEGTISLGFLPASSYSLLPRLVSFLATEMSHVEIFLKEMPTEDQIEALSSNRIDAGIIRLPIDNRGLESVYIDREEFILAMQSGRAMPDGRDLTLQDLDKQPFIMYAPIESRYHHDLVSNLLRSAGVAPQFVQYAQEVHTMLALVGAGIGVGLVPEGARKLMFDGVAFHPVKITPKTYSELTFVWRRRTDNPALKVFTQFLLPKFLDQSIG